MGVKSSPSDLVGHMPFIHNGSLFPWSKLDPGGVRLLLFVSPETQYLVDKNLIKKSPPSQGLVPTFFLCQNLRTTEPQHKFLTFMEEQMEAHVSQYGGYLIPPSKEMCFKKQKGHLPEWINVKGTQHIMCEKGKL